ncbi:MAG: hypothetical protein AB7S56_09730 [Halothiobacillaceae bacterium]
MDAVTGGEDKKSAAYHSRARQLWARYEDDEDVEDVEPNPNWSGFIDWLISIRATLRPASWRQYRAAVVHRMEQQHVPDRHELHARLMAFVNLPDRKTLPARTSSARCKSLSDADLRALIQHLGAQDGIWDRIAGQWLVFGGITGLRPGEWQSVRARPNEDEMILYVKNSKHDAVRAHGPERTLHVRASHSLQRNLLTFIQSIQSEDFDDVYEGCRNALWRATKALWPRRKKQISLYSARHQFAADAKSAGLMPEMIAALMGHAVTETHQTHYGKRRSGHGRVMVEAEPSEVMRVAERMQQKTSKASSGVGAMAHW